MLKPTFEARSQDLAAYLDALGIPFLSCYRNLYGKVRYLFDNANDDAWQYSLEFRDGTNATINAPAYAASFRKMQTEARKARVQVGATLDDRPAA